MAEVSRRLFTVAEYEAMGRVGILGPEDRVELVEGEIFTMSPIGPRHAYAVTSLDALLQRAIGDRGVIPVQNPVVLGDISEPQPDLQVVRGPLRRYRDVHPTASDVLLVVEVSDSSLRFDLEVKVPLFARWEIPEAWVVDLSAGEVVVHRGPSGGRYGSVERVAADGEVSPGAFPDVRMAVRDVVG